MQSYISIKKDIFKISEKYPEVDFLFFVKSVSLCNPPVLYFSPEIAKTFFHIFG